MSDLVKRLRRAKGSELLPKILLGHKNAEIACLEAADRIEELERELVRERNERREEGFKQVKELERKLADCQADHGIAIRQLELAAENMAALADQLAAEKSLADALYENKDGSWRAYRKARGL